MAATVTVEQAYALARQAGATHDEAIILAAIAGGESGYNNRAHNPNAGTGDNSYGLWQINMLGKMGPERRKWFGITSNEQLFDPLINAQAAVKILRSQGWKAWTIYRNGSYKKFLPAAQRAGASVGNNYEKVAVQGRVTGMAQGARSQVGGTPGDMGVLGGEGGAGGGGGTGMSGSTYAPSDLPPDASPEQIEAYIRENNPDMAPYLEVPEIREILIESARADAAGSGWSPEKLQSKIKATTWWRTNSDSARQALFLKSTDPASYAKLIDQRAADLSIEQQRLGLEFDTRAFAEEAVKYGWTDQQVRDTLANHMRAASDKAGLKEGSTADVSADTLARIARTEYLVPLNRQDVEKWAIDIFQGVRTEEQYRNYLETLAKGRFGDVIAMGSTPGEYMAPIRNIIAETLELQPDDIDLLNQRWAEVLQFEGGNGLRPMTLSEAGKWARNQDEFKYTKGAADTAADFVETLGRTFGSVA